jgi:hypothetical protein
VTEPTKRCCTCGLERPLTDFNVRRAADDGLQSRCRACSKEWYERNRLTHMANVRRNSKAIIARNRILLAAYLADNPCVDCGESDIRCLDFDHRDAAEKVDDVARLMCNALSWRRILAEIEKCDVRCANCHRRVTVERGGWWRQAVYLETQQEVAAISTTRLERLLPPTEQRS